LALLCAGDAVRELASECGFEFDDEGTAVIDHLHFDSQLDDGRHTTIVADARRLLAAPLIVGADTVKSGAPLLFRGAGMIRSDTSLTLNVLTTDSTAYSFNPDAPVNEVGGPSGHLHIVCSIRTPSANQLCSLVPCKHATMRACSSPAACICSAMSF
jgi:hypothetical protein